MKRKSSRKKSSAQDRRGKVPHRMLTTAEHDFVRRSVGVLADLHGARSRVSARSRTALDQLETHVLGQLDALQESLAVTKKLSGASWVNEFPDAKVTSALTKYFAAAVDKFIAAMKAGDASVSIDSTYRPLERAYLMHYSWLVSQKQVAAADVPAMTGVDIEWVHPTDAQSVQAAKDMVSAYHIVREPVLASRHTQRRAIDMTITWAGTLKIAKADGTSTSITTTPHSGENADLISVGGGYGVIKAKFAGDPPHWSDDGH